MTPHYLIIRLHHAYKTRALRWAEAEGAELVLRERALLAFSGTCQLCESAMQNYALRRAVQCVSIASIRCKDRNELILECVQALHEHLIYKLIVHGDQALKEYLLKSIPESIQLKQRGHTHLITIEVTAGQDFFLGISQAHYDTFEALETKDVSSRSYYKLAEASRKWPQLDKVLRHGNVIDVGAAPGGWSQFCLEDADCAKLIAIDPAALDDARFTSIHQSRFIHLRKRVENCKDDLTHHLNTAHAILCDANSHPNAAVRAFLPVVAPFLKPDLTCLLLTLKQTNITQKQTDDECIGETFSEVIDTLAIFGFDLDLEFSWLWANSRKERTLFVRYRGTTSSPPQSSTSIILRSSLEKEGHLDDSSQQTNEAQGSLSPVVVTL